MIHVGDLAAVLVVPSTGDTLIVIKRSDLVRVAAARVGKNQKENALILATKSKEAGNRLTLHVFDVAGASLPKLVHDIEHGMIIKPASSDKPWEHPTAVSNGSVMASPAGTSGYGDTDIRVVKLMRGPRGFGFMFSTNTAEYSNGVNHYVSSVDHGGIAEREGLRPGDRLLEVNGSDVVSLSHEMVALALSKHPTSIPVALTVAGPNELIKRSLKLKEHAGSGKLG